MKRKGHERKSSATPLTYDKLSIYSCQADASVAVLNSSAPALAARCSVRCRHPRSIDITLQVEHGPFVQRWNGAGLGRFAEPVHRCRSCRLVEYMGVGRPIPANAPTLQSFPITPVLRPVRDRESDPPG